MSTQEQVGVRFGFTLLLDLGNDILNGGISQQFIPRLRVIAAASFKLL